MLRRIHAITGGGQTFWAFTAMVVVSAVLQACAVLTLFPLLADMFSDDPAAAWPWVLVFVGIIAVVWAIDIVAAHLGLALGVGVMRAVHRHAPRAILSWPDQVFSPAKTGSLRTLLSSGAHDATSMVILMVTPVVTAVVFTFALGIGLLFVNAVVAVVTVAGGLLVLGALWASTRLERRAEAEFTGATETLDNRLFEYAWAQPSLRTARRTSAGEQLVDDAIDTTRGRMLKLLLWQIPGQFVFSLALQAVLVGYGLAVWLAYDNGALTAVASATMIIVVLRVVEHVTTVSGSTTGVIAINRTLAEVREMMAVEEVHPRGRAQTPPRVRAHNLDVTYPDGTTGIHQASLELTPGTITVVVGHSGSGKSTLLRALAGLTPPTDGHVSIDGTPADTGQLRDNASVVFQSTALNSGTLRDNLTAVNPELSQADLDRIATESQLRPILERVPHGWNEPVGELGGHLSGGERQRVGIARSLAKPSRVLVIDEPTSALDTRNEQAVVGSLDTVRGSYTTVIVTHQPAIVDIADQVIVMAHGRPVEAGTPAELTHAGGDFAPMMQQRRQAVDWRVR